MWSNITVWFNAIAIRGRVDYKDAMGIAGIERYYGEVLSGSGATLTCGSRK